MRFIRNSDEDTPRGHTKDAIERMILARGYRVGDKLPTYRELARHYGIAVRTVERVMRQLADDGTVRLMHGKGAFVRRLPAGNGQISEIALVYPASRVHFIETGYLNQILGGIVGGCDYYGIDPQIVSLRTGPTTSAPISPREICLRTDGVVLIGVINEAYIKEFASETVPLVLVDGQTDQSIHCISVDNVASVDLVMNHLYSLGHRRIGYLDARGSDDLAQPGTPRWVESVDTRERREAYLAAMKRLGLDYRWVVPMPDDNTAHLDGIGAMLRDDPSRPTAILAYDGLLASNLYRILNAVGLRVPRDVSIAAAVGLNTDLVADSLVITSSVADFRMMGLNAVVSLRRQATGQRGAGPRVERVTSTLRVGTSTVPPGG